MRAWLLETTDFSNAPRWFAGGSSSWCSITEDASKAIKFVTKEDAETLKNCLAGVQYPIFRATEHVWLTLKGGDALSTHLEAEAGETQSNKADAPLVSRGIVNSGLLSRMAKLEDAARDAVAGWGDGESVHDLKLHARGIVTLAEILGQK